MKVLSLIIIPLIVLIIITYALFKKVNIYDSFVEGAKDGLGATLNIFPYIIAMIFAVNIFLKSGVLDYVLEFTRNIFSIFKFPIEVLPMAIMRPISGNASLVLLNDIFKNFGPDSFIGRLASTIQGCTDTTFYIITLYFGSVKITKSRYALKLGLIADLIGIIASIIVVSLIFY